MRVRWYELPAARSTRRTVVAPTPGNASRRRVRASVARDQVAVPSSRRAGGRCAGATIRGEPPRLVEPKTRQSRRTLPLPAVLAAQLRAHRPRQREERLRAGELWRGKEWGLVFATRTGEPLSGRTLVKQFKAHLTRAGLPDIRFHGLRHSCASLLLAQEIHPRVVMEILGHSTITLTMDTYSHVLPVAQRAAADLIDRLFGERAS